jgi:hypothetical protein
MPDDLGEYDSEVRNRMSELDLEGLFNSDSMTDQDVAQRELAQRQMADEAYRGSLAGLMCQHRQILREVRHALARLAASAEAINRRAGLVLIGYTGGGRLQKWLVKRAWKRIAAFHNVSLSQLLSDMPKGHCADHWECNHDPSVDCDDVAAERRGLESLGGQSNKAFLDLMAHAEGMLEGRENLERALDRHGTPVVTRAIPSVMGARMAEQLSYGSTYHELVDEKQGYTAAELEEGSRPRPFPQPPPARVRK